MTKSTWYDRQMFSPPLISHSHIEIDSVHLDSRQGFLYERYEIYTHVFHV